MPARGRGPSDLWGERSSVEADTEGPVEAGLLPDSKHFLTQGANPWFGASVRGRGGVRLTSPADGQIVFCIVTPPAPGAPAAYPSSWTFSGAPGSRLTLEAAGTAVGPIYRTH